LIVVNIINFTKIFVNIL